MHRVLIFIAFSIARKIVGGSLIDEIQNHFASNTAKEFHKLWEKQRVSYETAIELALADSYGTSGGTMNVLTKHALENAQEMMDGFYVEDGTIGLLLQNVRLREIPHLLFPDVVFNLDKAVLRLESSLSKMFVEAKYEVFRNSSSLILDEWPPEPFQHSPFIYSEVPKVGAVTFIASNCRLIGHAVVHLKGSSADVGHMAFKLEGCSFSIELLAANFQPVIAPYLNVNQGEQLMLRMAKPIIVELEPKLEGAVTTLFNSTDMFVKDLEKYVMFQKNFLYKSHQFAGYWANDMSDIMFEEGKQVIPLNNFLVTFSSGDLWDTKTSIEITDATLNGLENVYAARRGCFSNVDFGFFFIDALRFQRLQVRGKIAHKNTTHHGSYDFAVELQDVQVNLFVHLSKSLIDGHMEPHSDVEVKPESDCNNNQTRREDLPFLDPPDPTTSHDYFVGGWRNVEYILIDLKFHITEKMLAYTFVSGYINNNVIPALENVLSDIFPKVQKRMLNDNSKSGKKKELKSRRKHLKKKKYYS